MAREIERFEFVPGAPERVLEWMDRLSAADDGWINLLPGIDEDEAERPTSPGAFAALFGPSQAPVTMCTWLPARRGRRGGERPTVGIVHPRGRFAVRQLADLDVALPRGWAVSQDHARRGLIVMPPPETPHAAVLAWSLEAGAALATVPLTGTWQAEVHQPAGPQRRR
ncbi:MAG: hypothetical protein ACYCU7_10400 [Acidimicrobiales bacterium]